MHVFAYSRKRVENKLIAERKATETIVDFAHRASFESLPADVVELGRVLLLDSIGCALGGHGVAKGAIAIGMAEDFGQGDAVSIVGGSKAALLAGAFANGELMNAIDMDACVVPGHVTPYVVPPVLAAAEKGGCSGRELVRGIVLAHEVAARVGGAYAGLRTQVNVNGETRAELSPATGYGTTTVGGAVGAGIAFGFDLPTLLNCFGIAGYMAPVPALAKYLRLSYSPTAKYTSAGWVAMGSVLAARLAGNGYTGDREVLDGEYGFWRMCASPTCDWDFMLDGLNTVWHTRESEFKPYPSFRMGHPGIEAFLKLLADEKISAEAIEKIDIRCDPVAASPIYLNREIRSHSDAYISWSHVFGVAPFYPPGPAWQSREAMEDRRVKTLGSKISVRGEWARTTSGDGAAAALVHHPVEVIVQARGKRYEAHLMPYPKGHPKRPLAKAELEAKFLHNASWRLPQDRAEKLLRALDKVLDMDDLSPLFAAMRQ